MNKPGKDILRHLILLFSLTLLLNANVKSAVAAVSCVAGQYLPANTTQCASCPGTRKYCPGGSFSTSDSDQGIFNCPTNTVTDASGAACVIKLNQDIMKYGPNGKKKSASDQCWTQREIRNYAECVTKNIKNSSGNNAAGITVPKLKPEEMPTAPMLQDK